MLPRELRKSGRLAVLGATVGAVALLSCGGPSDHTTGPSLSVAETGSDQAGMLAASGGKSANTEKKAIVCHRGQEISVSLNAVSVHLRHGDTLGSCAVACPCYDAAGIEATAALCDPSWLIGSCPVTYSLGLFCAPGGPGGTVGNLGYWEVVVNSDSCGWTYWDPVTGDEITQSLPVDADQFQACKAAIVNASAYPDACPL